MYYCNHSHLPPMNPHPQLYALITNHEVFLAELSHRPTMIQFQDRRLQTNHRDQIPCFPHQSLHHKDNRDS
jgi:hypothetical protein